MRWSPDTCTCILEWDGATDKSAEKTLKFIRKCNDHRLETDPYIVKSENVTKNSVVKDIVEIYGGSPNDVSFKYERKGDRGHRTAVVKLSDEIKYLINSSRVANKNIDRPYVRFEE